MKKIIKSLSVCMSAILAGASAFALPLTASAAEITDTSVSVVSGNYVFAVTDNKATITDYIGDESYVSIPNKLDGYSVVKIGDYAFSGKESILEVSVPDGVTTIGASTFQDSENITKIKLSNDIARIDVSAFCGCKSLKNINIPNSLTYIEDYTFSECESLIGITVPESVESIGQYSFEGCTSLTRVEGLSSVSYIGESAFEECCYLEYIDLSNVTCIDYYAFFACLSLPYVDLSQCDTIYNGAFACCYSLESIEFSDTVYSIPTDVFLATKWYDDMPDGVVYAGKLAYEMKGDFTDKKLEFKDGTIAVNDDFLWCNETIETIVLPDSVYYIGASAFESCTAIKSVTIPDFCTVSAMAFYGCTNLNTINYDEESVWTAPSAFEETGWYNSQPDGILYHGKSACCYKGDFKVAEIIKEGTTVIVDGLFYSNDVLETIEIPDSVEYIGAMAFENCTKLKSIKLPKSLYAVLDETFLGCDSLEIVDLGGAESIGEYAFAYCPSLKEINLSESKIYEIGDSAFLSCVSLEKITLNSEMEYIGFAAFLDCEGLKSITVLNNVEEIGDDAFKYCDDLVISCYENSVAYQYAQSNGIEYTLISTERIFGDINNDGKTDINDVTFLQRYIAGVTDENGNTLIPDSDLNFADITADGVIDSRDVTQLQLLLSGK